MRFINNAYTELKNNNLGFTYISLLLSLIIIISTLPILGFLISNVEGRENQTYLAVHQFFSIIESDINGAFSTTSNEEQLYLLLRDGKIAILEQYDDTVRRKVDNRGHEVYLFHVDSFKIQSWKHGFIVTITMQNGESYEKKFATK